MVYLLALGAGLLNALTSVLQRKGAAPAEGRRGLALVRFLLQRPAYLSGFGLMIGALVLQALALRGGSVPTVESVLVSELLFTLVILRVRFKVRLGRSEWTAAGCIVVGLAGFLAAAAPQGGTADAPALSWVLAGGGFAAAAAVLLVLTRQLGKGALKAAAFGAVAGSGFAVTAALVKRTVTELGTHGLGTFADWPPYAVAASGLLSVFLAANAFSSGPLTASQPALTIADPLVSLVVGIGVLHETIATAPGRLVGAALLLGLLVFGIVLLTRSPVVHGMRVDTAEGGLAATGEEPSDGLEPARVGAGR